MPDSYSITTSQLIASLRKKIPDLQIKCVKPSSYLQSSLSLTQQVSSSVYETSLYSSLQAVRPASVGSTITTNPASPSTSESFGVPITPPLLRTQLASFNVCKPPSSSSVRSVDITSMYRKTTTANDSAILPISVPIRDQPVPEPESTCVAHGAIESVPLSASRASGFEEKVLKDLASLNNAFWLMQSRMDYLTDHRSQASNENSLSCVLPHILNEEDLNLFESNLGNSSYCETIKASLRNKIRSNDPKNRMHDAFIILSSKTFLVECSWRGGGRMVKKVRIDDKINILMLFRDVGETNLIPVSETDVERFFIVKLKKCRE